MGFGVSEGLRERMGKERDGGRALAGDICLDDLALDSRKRG